jgi:hypothetical protein
LEKIKYVYLREKPVRRGWKALLTLSAKKEEVTY